MRIKEITIKIAIMALVCLCIAGSAISQETVKNLPGMNRIGIKKKSLQTDTNHFAIFPEITNTDQAFLRKSAKYANYRLDSLFKYSINYGNKKAIYSYMNDTNVLNWIEQVWVINKWVNNRQTIRTFDVNGNVLTETGQRWQNNAWANSGILTRTFDGSGNLLHIVQQFWIDSAWVNIQQGYYTYDGNGNMLTYLFQQWDTTAWVNASLDSSTYSGNGKLLTLLEKVWADTIWTDYSLQTNTYDVNWNLLTINNQVWADTAWVNNTLETFTYDGSGNVLTDLNQQYWDGTNWGFTYMYTYTCDADGNLLSYLQQTWDPGSGTWLNWSNYVFTYDTNGNRLTYVDWESYDQVTWTENLNEACTYDTNNNILSSIYQFQCYTGTCVNGWDAEYNYQPGLITSDGHTWTGTEWTTGDVGNIYINYHDNGNIIPFFPDFMNDANNLVQVLAYYSSAVAGIDSPAGDRSGIFTVYPNPAHDHLTILPSGQGVKIENLQIFDITGKEQHVNLANNCVDLSNLPNGLYFLKLTTFEGQTIMKKVVKQ